MFSYLLNGNDAAEAPDLAEVLRLEVKQPFITLHVYRHGNMLVRDQPLAVKLAEANGCAHPVIDFLSVFSRATEAIEAVAESHLRACAVVEVGGLTVSA